MKEIKPDTLLFREGLLDSMGFIRIITFIDENFKIKISDEDLIEKNFESIDAISHFIIEKSKN
jgi:acyl carrier protein